MKKVLASLLMIVATVLTGCSNETNDIIPNTTSVVLSPSTQLVPQSRTDVKRGTIYPWVKSINVTATQIPTNHNVTETYNLVSNSSEVTSDFILENVGLGLNEFEASTTTDSESKMIFEIVGNSLDKDAIIKTFTDKNPYAIYKSPLLQKQVSNDLPNIITIPMHTEHGRRVSLFRVERSIQSRYDFSVTTVIGDKTITSEKVTGNKGIVFYFSSEDSVDGVEIKHTLNVLYKGTNYPAHGDFTIAPELIEASVSRSCTYTIRRADTWAINGKTLDFVFDPWRELGYND